MYDKFEVPIRSERLDLVLITPSLIHDLFESTRQKQIQDIFGFDEKLYLKYKLMHEKGMETYNVSLRYFLIVERETTQPIGEIGFHTWNTVHNRAELFYSLREDQCKRKGFMSEALPLVLEYGFNVMNLRRIEALIAKTNEPSFRLLQKNNFSFEGTMRQDYFWEGEQTDSDCYSLLRSEFSV